MKYTFEITIAGCAANCAHCYVCGGPGPQMKFHTFQFIIQKLKPILDKLSGDIAVTLGNELFCHSQITDVLSFTAKAIPQYFSFREDPVPTTGIALVDREDRDQIIENLKQVGASGFMLAVHGSEQSHNQIVQRSSGYTKLFEAADYFAQRDMDILFNLIISKPLCTDFRKVMRKVSSYPHADVALTVPLYVPTNRMRIYQSHRAEYRDCMELADAAVEYGINTETLLAHCRNHNEAAVISRLQTEGFSYREEQRRATLWKFFHIMQNGDLFYGNAGAHTKYLGNLFRIQDDKLLEEILQSAPNYDYTAYYSEEVFFSLEKQLNTLPPRTHNYVYAGKAECIYALLDEIGVKNALI